MEKTRQPPDLVPDGLLVNRAWLRAWGVTRPAIDYYVRSGALQRIAQGLYRRPGPPLPWESVVYSLQELGYGTHVGGETALEEQGFGHFVPMARRRKVALYSYTKLPHWLTKWHQEQPQTSLPYYFEVHRHYWLKDVLDDYLVSRSVGQWNWRVKFATPELALFELLVAVRGERDFQYLDRVFEAFGSLSPRRLESLLAVCPSIKAKRLFGWFAQRHNHAWFEKIDWQMVDVGSGKRSIIKGGRYDPVWQVTVPRSLEADRRGSQ